MAESNENVQMLVKIDREFENGAKPLKGLQNSTNSLIELTRIIYISKNGEKCAYSRYRGCPYS